MNISSNNNNVPLPGFLVDVDKSAELDAILKKIEKILNYLGKK